MAIRWSGPRFAAKLRKAPAQWRERWTDLWIHKSLMLAKLPAVFLNARSPRLERWPHEDAGVYAQAA